MHSTFEEGLPYPALTLLVLALFYGIYFGKVLAQKRRGIQTRQIGRRKEPDIHTVEMLMSVATLGVPAAQLLSVLFGWNHLPAGARFAGFCIGMLGNAIFLLAVLSMKDSWRAGIPDGDRTELVTTGLYRYSRNPAFLAFDFMYAGVLLLYGNLLTLGFSMFAAGMLHLQILQEERYLEDTFGAAYIAYKKQVSRYLGRKACMPEIFKRGGQRLLLALLVLAAAFLAGRYGWRVLGFRTCRGAEIESVSVRADKVEIRGFYPGEAAPEGGRSCYAEERDGKLRIGSRFKTVRGQSGTGTFDVTFPVRGDVREVLLRCSCCAREQDGRLYVGFRPDTAFGFSGTGNFNVTVPVKGEIREVILKTGAGETCIWTRKDGTIVTASDGGKCGVYVRLECDDAGSVFLKSSGFSKECESAAGAPLKTGEWIFMGGNAAKCSAREKRAVLITVGARTADGTLLAEDDFLYDAAQEKLYVTISADGVRCTASSTGEDVPPVRTLPILEEIDRRTAGTGGASQASLQAAAELLDWGEKTGLGVDEIEEAASTWLAQQGDHLSDCLQRLSLVDAACRKLLADEPAEPVEAVMRAAGLRPVPAR